MAFFLLRSNYVSLLKAFQALTLNGVKTFEFFYNTRVITFALINLQDPLSFFSPFTLQRIGSK